MAQKKLDGSHMSPIPKLRVDHRTPDVNRPNDAPAVAGRWTVADRSGRPATRITPAMMGVSINCQAFAHWPCISPAPRARSGHWALGIGHWRLLPAYRQPMNLLLLLWRPP